MASRLYSSDHFAALVEGRAENRKPTVSASTTEPSRTQSRHPVGSGGQEGSGLQSGGGDHPVGGVGHPGGELKRIAMLGVPFHVYGLQTSGVGRELRCSCVLDPGGIPPGSSTTRSPNP
ncbi:MAG: hypothetical protein ACRDYA_23025, partial [Egibacteraceae bacterium]